jgi:hypothetical protein
LLQLPQRRRRLCLSIEDNGIIMPCRVETGCEAQAALEQLLRVLVPAQAGGHFRQHPQCRHVGRKGAKMVAQSCIGERQIIVHQGPGGRNEARVSRGHLQVARARCISGSAITVCIQVIGEQSPAVGRGGVELQCPPQSHNGPRQTACLGACHPKLQMDRCRVRLLATERFEYFQRLQRAAAAPPGGTQDQPRGGMRRIDVQNFARLFRGELGILLEQPLRMRDGHVDRPKGLRSDIQSRTLCIPVL